MRVYKEKCSLLWSALADLVVFEGIIIRFHWFIDLELAPKGM